MAYITVQPHHRDFLFDCRLILYLKSERLEDLLHAFRQPVFCVNLGRSQDLASIRQVQEVDMVVADSAYLESTILPFETMRQRVGRGITAMMPKYIGPPPQREPTVYERYVVLHDRIFAGRAADSPSISDAHRLLRLAGPDDETWFTDPETNEFHGMRRAIVFHRFN